MSVISFRLYNSLNKKEIICLNKGEVFMNGKREFIVMALTLATLQPSTHASATDLMELIPGLYGGDGITLAPPTGNFPSHETHFNVPAPAR
jgi:hypothetical protein